MSAETLPLGGKPTAPSAPAVPLSTYWDLSTSHLTPADLRLIHASDLLAAYGYPEGAFVSLDPHLLRQRQGRRALAREGFSPAFVAVVEKALAARVYLLRFDADAPSYESLPDASRSWEKPTGEGSTRPADASADAGPAGDRRAGRSRKTRRRPT